MVLGIAPRIHLLLESQQAEMSTLMGPETRNFNIIAQEVRIDGNLVILAGKKLFLVIEARTPGKVRSDLEILSLNMSKHVGGMHPFSRIRIMSTACGMNVMIAAPITKEKGQSTAELQNANSVSDRRLPTVASEEWTLDRGRTSHHSGLRVMEWTRHRHDKSGGEKKNRVPGAWLARDKPFPRHHESPNMPVVGLPSSSRTVSRISTADRH